MTITFKNIPQNLKIPLFAAEFDNSQAGVNQFSQRTLIIGQTITVVPKVLTYVATPAMAAGLFGNDSHQSMMMEHYRENDPFGEVWALPLPDGGGSAAAVGSIAFAGTATAAGTLALYIAGVNVNVGVTVGMTAAQLATAVAAAIQAALAPLPVSAATAGVSSVALTALNAGTLGNDIDLRVNYQGIKGGEQTPAGITVTFIAMAGGATDPDFSAMASIVGDELFDFIVFPYSTTGALDSFKTMMSDSTGRWSWIRQVYGQGFGARRGAGANEGAAVADLISFGAARNDPHMSVMGFYDGPDPCWAWAAEYAAAFAVGSKADAARPSQTLVMQGIKAPLTGSRFLKTEKQSLLSTGVALADYAHDGTVSILRSVTTYQLNSFGQPDQSYLDSETLFTLMAIIRTLSSATTQKFPRSKLADDGTKFGQGQAIVTPKSFRAELLAQYDAMIDQGLVEDLAGFAAGLIVQRNTLDPSRLDVLFDPHLVSGLRVLAVLAQFRLGALAAAA